MHPSNPFPTFLVVAPSFTPHSPSAPLLVMSTEDANDMDPVFGKWGALREAYKEGLDSAGQSAPKEPEKKGEPNSTQAEQVPGVLASEQPKLKETPVTTTESNPQTEQVEGSKEEATTDKQPKWLKKDKAKKNEPRPKTYI